MGQVMWDLKFSGMIMRNVTPCSLLDIYECFEAAFSSKMLVSTNETTWSHIPIFRISNGLQALVYKDASYVQRFYMLV
jgi:hypothetical protein